MQGLAVAGEPGAVFTGGSLLYGTVGRTDLISPDATAGLTTPLRYVDGVLGGPPGGDA